MTLTSGSMVRFVSDARNGEWRKGQLAKIEKVIATPSQNQNSLYIVWWKGLLDIKRVWVTDRDVEPFDQLTIFDALADLATEQASSDNP